MKIRETIPCIYQIFNQEIPIWEKELLEINFYEVNQLIEIAFEQLIQEPNNNVVARDILKDILNAKKVACEEEILKLNFLQFIACTHAAKYYNCIGIYTESHDWLVYSISDDIEFTEETVFHLERVDSFFVSTDEIIAYNAIPTLFNWLNSLFYYSRSHGGLVEFASGIIENNAKIVIEFLNRPIPPNINGRLVVKTACEILAWSINYKQESSSDYAKNLESYFESTEDRLLKKMIALQLTVGGSEHTNRSSSDWALVVMTDYPDLLIGSQRMHLLAKYYSINIELLKEGWANFKGAIREYLSSLHGDPILLKYEKSTVFGTLGGVILSCLERGWIEIANNIIAEFYVVEKTKQFTKEQLYVVCNYNYGVLYASTQGMISLKRENPVEFVKVLSQTNRYLSTTIALKYLGFKLEIPKSLGVPIIPEGIRFEELLIAHYQFEKLSQFKLDAIDSMIIIPGFQHPIQSLMIKKLGVTFPISVSFERPNPKRKIKKVLIWCFGTRTSELEISLTKQMFESGGIEVEAVNILEVTKTDFISFYKSEEYDLFWIGTHGNYNQFLPHLSTIDLHPDGEIELAELFELAPDTKGQRMLFMNICDGATSSTLNAVYDLGLGASLCSRNQAVLSHIWMVRIESSFIYGVLYAHYLLTADDFYIAYENVVESFLKGKEHIRKLLTPYCDLEAELMSYIDQLDDKVHENIYYWGSGVYYQ